MMLVPDDEPIEVSMVRGTVQDLCNEREDLKNQVKDLKSQIRKQKLLISKYEKFIRRQLGHSSISDVQEEICELFHLEYDEEEGIFKDTK